MRYHFSWCAGRFRLAEAVEPAEGEPPRSSVDTIAASGDVGTEMLAAEALGVEERHLDRDVGKL